MLSSQSGSARGEKGPAVEGSMHVGPADFRSIRREGLVLRFAILGEVAYVLADVPEARSGRTTLEAACRRPHWAFVVSGEVELDAAPAAVTVPGGSAFHVADGVAHGIRAGAATRLAGFEPVDVRQDVTDAALRARGFEVLAHAAETSTAGPPALEWASQPVEIGEIVTAGTPMGDLLFSQTRFGASSGYASPFCDLEHWGQVAAGNIAIEWENDIEVLSAGDVFYCPPGPPGHRFLAADPSATIDFTPLAAFARGGRIIDWRQAVAARVRQGKGRRGPVQIAPLR
jgi:quercetin dioxygenase-like cupin family protein